MKLRLCRQTSGNRKKRIKSLTGNHKGGDVIFLFKSLFLCSIYNIMSELFFLFQSQNFWLRRYFFSDNLGQNFSTLKISWWKCLKTNSHSRDQGWLGGWRGFRQPSCWGQAKKFLKFRPTSRKYRASNSLN